MREKKFAILFHCASPAGCAWSNYNVQKSPNKRGIPRTFNIRNNSVVQHRGSSPIVVSQTYSSFFQTFGVEFVITICLVAVREVREVSDLCSPSRATWSIGFEQISRKFRFASTKVSPACCSDDPFNGKIALHDRCTPFACNTLYDHIPNRSGRRPYTRLMCVCLAVFFLSFFLPFIRTSVIVGQDRTRSGRSKRNNVFGRLWPRRGKRKKKTQ